MKKQAVSVGQTYLAKVSGKMVTVRIDGPNPFGGWYATNLSSHHHITIRNAGRLRGPAPKGPMAAPMVDYKSRAAGEREEGEL